jgi:hypothetical protein
MDPIHPITPGSSPIERLGRLPVQAPERITRDRDRPSRDGGRQRRRQPPPEPPPQRGEDDEGRPRIDVRV